MRGEPTTAGTVNQGFRISYEPILDVARGLTAGFRVEASAGRPTPGGRATGTLDDRTGMFTAAVLVTALAESAARRPPNTFVMVPIGAAVAATRPVRTALGSFGDLRGVVLDVCGFSATAPIAELETALLQYRDNGALIAVGGQGAAQPELSSIVRLKPSILRLGRDWVRGIGRYDAKRSAIEVVGQLASQLDAWILAEGVSGAEELRTLAELEVPLARGPFIGDAGDAWPPLHDQVTAALPAPVATEVAATAPEAPLAKSAVALKALLQPACVTFDALEAASDPVHESAGGLVVVLDEHQHPTSMLTRVGSAWEAVEAMTVNVDTAVSEAVVRAMIRPRLARFTPLACTDEAGRFAGVVRIERLMAHLARDDVAKAAEPEAARTAV